VGFIVISKDSLLWGLSQLIIHIWHTTWSLQGMWV